MATVAFLLSVLFGSGCSVSSFVCFADHECGTQGRCEADSVCSFPDSGCASGRRYGRHSGSYSGACTDSIDPEVDEPSAPLGDDDVEPFGSTGEDDADDADDDADTWGGAETSAGFGTSEDEGGSASGASGAGTDPDMEMESGGEGSTGDPLEFFCDVVYGEVEGYELCEVTEEAACMFFAQTNGSCEELCANVGGACLTAFHDVGNTCEIALEVGCGHPADSLVCVCI